MPGMADSTMRGGWAGAITLTEDGKPILDRHPEVDGLFVFTGDSGSSFKTAPAIGRIDVSLMHRRRVDVQIPAVPDDLRLGR